MIKTIKYPVLDNTLRKELHVVFEKWNCNPLLTEHCIQEVIVFLLIMKKICARKVLYFIIRLLIL